MTGKEFLLELQRLNEAAMAAEAQLESIRADVERTTARLSPAPGGGTADPASGIIRLMQIKQRCERKIEEYNRHKARCIELIGMIDADYQRALTLVYINYLSKAAAAEEIGCSRTWLERRLKRGLAQLDKLI
ncbi:MAG: DUF1492 domain-containing protein [Clostridia bacterium]|nr:DUF1492 domain-containing protein [Clostridia bacterium]